MSAAGGAMVRAALDALARPDGAADERTLEQRHADALVELCRAYLDAGTLPEVAAQRPRAIVITSSESLAGPPGAPASHLDGYGPVSSTTARMLVCEQHPRSQELRRGRRSERWHPREGHLSLGVWVPAGP